MRDILQKPQGGSEAEEDTIDIGALIGTLWRGKWLIAIVTGIAMTLAIYYAYFVAIPMYRSTAVVILQTKQDSIVDLQSVAGGLSGDSTEVNTQVEVLRSRGLAEKVVERLNLIEDPEFNGSLREPSLIGSVIGMIKSIIRPSSSDAIAQDEVLKKNRIRDNVTANLLSKIAVSNIRQSLVFNIAVETQSPVKSAKIADTLSEIYILNQIEVKFAATDATVVVIVGPHLAAAGRNLVGVEASVAIAI